MSDRFDESFWNGLRDAEAQVPVPSLELTRCDNAHVVGGSRARRDHAQLASPELPPAARGTLSIVIPDNYEPNYAYPLLVWLRSSSEQHIETLMSHISTQNYLGLALDCVRWLDGVRDATMVQSRSEAALTRLETRLHDAVYRLRRRYHIHSERIYVAGFDRGATAALSLLLRRPEWLAGAIALHGKLPRRRRPLARFRELQGKRVLLATGQRDRLASVGEVERTARLLHTAGMHVTARIGEGGHELTPQALRQVDHWLMEGLCAIA